MNRYDIFFRKDNIKIVKVKTGKNKGKYTYDEMLNIINFDNYYIIKSTGSFRFLSKDDIIKEAYAGYLLFDKKVYDINEIQNWLDFLNSNIRLRYISKPFPPLEILNKIVIK